MFYFADKVKELGFTVGDGFTVPKLPGYPVSVPLQM
jgi:hypothetical protein